MTAISQPPARPNRRDYWAMGVLLGAAVVTRVLVPNGFAGELPFLLAPTGAFILLVAARARGRSPVAWGVLAAGVGLTLAAEGVWAGQELTAPDAFPTPGDLLYALGLAALVVGIWMTARGVTTVGDRTGFLDAGVVALAAAAMAWLFVIAPAASRDDLSAAEQVSTVVVLALEIALLTVTARLAFALRARSVRYLLVYLAVVGTVLPDVLDGLLETSVGIELGRAEDVIVMISYGCWGAATLVRGPPLRTTPASELSYLGHRRLALLSVCAAVPLVGLCVRSLAGAPLDRSTTSVMLAVGLALAVFVALRVGGLIATNRRLTEEKGQERFAAVVENSSDVIVVVDRALRINYVSPSVGPAWGHAPSDLIGTGFPTMVERSQRGELTTLLLRACDLAPRATLAFDIAVSRHDGVPRDCEIVIANLLDHPGVDGLVLTLRDVTDRRNLERELNNKAFRDQLTGLANRALFLDRVGHALTAHRDRPGEDVVVLYLDVDGFKAVNDGLGHAAGDELLVAVGERVRSCVRAADTVARLGSDEFAVLMVGPGGLERALSVAHRALEVLALPLPAGGLDLGVRASVGVAVAGLDTTLPEELVRDADLAMYDAKRGGGAVAIFDGGMREAATNRISLQADLERALEDGQLRVVYQPIVDLQTGQVASSEALLRWDHPSRGPVSPVDFIPLAEESGQIRAIGRWVLEQACHDAARWPAADRPIGVSVNVSAVQLRDAEVVQQVGAALDATGLDPARLTIEITETSMMADPAMTTLLIERLSALGVRISVDDFGTGYCSLSYLARFAVDALKIDQSFVADMGRSGAPLAESILRLADGLGIPAVAEGIEDPEQLARLRDQGCAYGQGFHLGRPMATERFVEFIAVNRSLVHA